MRQIAFSDTIQDALCHLPTDKLGVKPRFFWTSAAPANLESVPLETVFYFGISIKYPQILSEWSLIDYFLKSDSGLYEWTNTGVVLGVPLLFQYVMYLCEVRFEYLCQIPVFIHITINLSVNQVPLLWVLRFIYL